MKTDDFEMSMISKQVKKLRIVGETCRQMGKEGIAKFLSEASDTIEVLSAKVAAANMERLDTISRNKLIEEIEKEIDSVIIKDTYSKGKNAGLRKAKILAEEQKTEYCVGGWIACDKDNFPDKEVLCCDQCGEMIIGYIFEDLVSSTGFSAKNDDCYMFNCVKWMEKPKP